jgi:hypothetical protein
MIIGDGTGGTDGIDSVILIHGLIATTHLVIQDLVLIIGHLIHGAPPAGTAIDFITTIITGAIHTIMFINPNIILITMFILVLVHMVPLPPATEVRQDHQVGFSPIRVLRVTIRILILVVLEEPLPARLK